MKKTSLRFILSLIGLLPICIHAETPASMPPASIVVSPPPKQASFRGGAMQQPRMMPGPPDVTPAQMEVLNQARMELQRDPELKELNAQIKALIDKRAKLTEEKLQKINPEAAALVQHMKDRQEKMMAERKAQVEAMQAQYKAQQEAATKAAADKPVPAPTTAATTPAIAASEK